MTDLSSIDSLKTHYEKHGQSHVFDMIDINDKSILEYLKKLSVEKLSEELERAQQWTKVNNPPLPLSKSFKFDASKSSEMKSKINNVGEKAIKYGKVGAVIMSGGQGTRLGFDGPKGMYNFGLLSSKSIFQIHIERLLRISQLVNQNTTNQDNITTNLVPVYIMTSHLNDTQIRDYFESNNYFGYDKTSIYFFQQELKPCLSLDGKLIVENKNCISQAPDGNGGIYIALERSGALADMKSRGVEHLHVYGVDNVLTRAADPLFIGLCIHENAQVGKKVVWRAHKSEKVGVTVEIDGKMEILEYSEIPSDLADAEDDSGKLKYGAANICNHYLSVEFIEEILPKLNNVYHVCKKKIPYFDNVTNTTIKPEAVNGYKFELFIFDIFPFATRWTVMEVDRVDEFAPIKNAPGSASDGPEHAVAMLNTQWKKWLSNHNATISDKGDGIIEISPLKSYAGENLEEYQDQEIKSGVILA